MGKSEEEQILPGSDLEAQQTNPSSRNCNVCCFSCGGLKKLVTFKCVFVLLFGVAVVLSAVFWLPFFNFGDQRDLDLDYGGRDIVASFLLNKSVPFLEGYISQLEDDIFYEMSFPTTKVEILWIESLAESNMTKVVFAVESDATSQSLIRASFVYLITRQSSLHLTASLFGDPSSFEVLKFIGGITASPEQKAFLMQSVHLPFNFTLNYSIYQLLINFDTLTSQLRKGLHLSPYENLYLRLTNLKGSTVDPPTTVQSQVLLAVGINPLNSRLKQLAQTITGSNNKNLGLNNSVFGRVKQIQLSSILQHSLGSDANSPSPSPSLSRHDHRHNHSPSLTPVSSPSPSPVSKGKRHSIGRQSPQPAPPGKNKTAEPPTCRFGFNPWRHNKPPHSAPSTPPVHAPPTSLPQPKHNDPVKPNRIHFPPAPSPSKNVHMSHTHAQQPKVISLVSPEPSPTAASAGMVSANIWPLPFLVLLMIHL